jgi:hypothetical protein
MQQARPTVPSSEAHAGKVTYEIDADSRDVALRIRVVSESEQQARFAYAGVADKQKLEEVIAADTAEH